MISGTGSCCFGRATDGRTIKVGGWGHILGDQGSGYEIGLHALKAVVNEFDITGAWPALGQRLLRGLQLNEPEELVGWAQNAAKPDVASLAVEVFAAWAQRDRLASAILAMAASQLSQAAVACARRLAGKGDPVQFVFAGSVLLKQPKFVARVRRELRMHWPQAPITPLNREGAWGAVELAKQLCASLGNQGPELNAPPAILPVPKAAGSEREPTELTQVLLQSPTEQRNPRSLNLDQLAVARGHCVDVE